MTQLELCQKLLDIYENGESYLTAHGICYAACVALEVDLYEDAIMEEEFPLLAKRMETKSDGMYAWKPGEKEPRIVFLKDCIKQLTQ